MSKVIKLSEQDGFDRSFLAANEDNIGDFMESLQTMLAATLRQGLDTGRRVGGSFDYKEAAAGTRFPETGSDTADIAAEIGAHYDGTIRWHHPNAAFNITPAPLFDTVAAATVAMILNPNCLWDVTGGQMLLAEQKIVQALGADMFPGAEVGGFSTFGGKATLLYGIKMGIANCTPDHKKNGLKDDYVIFASDRAHYSIEDVADYLGLGTASVVRVPSDAEGTMDLAAFEEKLTESLQSGKKVAAVIANGGVTIDFCVDDAVRIKEICLQKQGEFGLDYNIHLHGDTVAGWAWMFADEKALDDSPASDRIREAKRKLEAIHITDSAGVDFHKTGLCPYNTTFFVAKRQDRMGALGSHAGQPKANPKFGDLHIHHITLENSRAATGIAAAYAAMLKLGRKGLTKYLRYQLGVRGAYEQAIASEFNDDFQVLNGHSLGFEIVVAARKSNGDPLEMADYLAVRDRLMSASDEANVPMVGFVPSYQTKEGSVPAFLIYPMSPHTDDAACKNLLRRLKDEVNALDPARAEPYRNASLEFKPPR